MVLKQINLVLANVSKIRSYSNNPTRYNAIPDELKGITKVETKIEKEITNSDGEQGEEGLRYEIYQLPFDDLFLKLEIRTDSYGYNERIETIQFARATEKVVRVYESIY